MLLSLLSCAFTQAYAAVTLTDVFTFDENMTSGGGYAMLGQTSGVSYSNGNAIIHSNVSSSSGYFLTQSTYNYTDNWSVQLDFQFSNTTGNAAKIFTTNNDGGTGLSLLATNSTDGSTLAFCKGASGYTGYGTASKISKPDGVNLQGAPVKLSIINRDSKIYVFLDDTQLSFQNGLDYMSHDTVGLSGGITLDKIMLGFGAGGTNGISSSNDLTVGNLNIYKFEGSDSMEDIKKGMGLVAVPEASTATLALLACSAFGLRRRCSR